LRRYTGDSTGSVFIPKADVLGFGVRCGYFAAATKQPLRNFKFLFSGRRNMISAMARFAISTVEVIAPDGVTSHWVVALPHCAAVAAVRRVIPPDHSAELSIRRFPVEGIRPGEVREVEPMTHANARVIQIRR
jgi:hypothetical protein